MSDKDISPFASLTAGNELYFDLESTRSTAMIKAVGVKGF
jgi:hypothetical protein